jgi:TatD DNase family protein
MIEMLFDTHAHLNDEAFEKDLEEVLDEIRRSPVKKIINCGFDEESSAKAVALAHKHSFLYATAGMHPHDAKLYDAVFEEELSNWLQDPRTVALGEIGLDYHYDLSPRSTQKEVFISQIQIAQRFDKPIVIHSREAVEDTYEILKRYAGGNQKILLHSFSQSTEMMKRYLENTNICFSVSGVVTFKNAHNVRETVSQIPMERLMIETDCPYMTPVPYRGKRNTPIYVRYVAEKVAEMKGLSYEEVCKVTYLNAIRFFDIKD